MQDTLRSNALPPCEGEEAQIEPGLRGERLAQLLAHKLADEGLAREEPVAEDWGWLVPIEGAPVPLGVACGHQDDDNELLCFLMPHSAVLREVLRNLVVGMELEGFIPTSSAAR